MYNEKREKGRSATSEDIYYCRCFYDTDFVPRWSKEIHTKSLNESVQGICIFTGRHYPSGTRLKIHSPNWSASKEGTVQWCKSFAVGRFKAGLQVR